MKKVLYGLFGAALLIMPLKGLSQEPEKKDSYEYNLLWKGWEFGQAKCSEDTVSFNLDGIHSLNFYKTDSTYQEISNFRGSEENYYYVKEGDSWKFKKYDFPKSNSKKKNEKRQNKIDNLETLYPEDVLMSSEIFSELEKKVIPETLKIVVMGEIYRFNKKFDKSLGDSLIEVQYDLPFFPKYGSDKVRVQEPVKVYLKKNEDGTHKVEGGASDLLYKFIGKWWTFNIDIKKK